MMPGGDGADADRGEDRGSRFRGLRFRRLLWRGSQQPPADSPAKARSALGDDIVRGDRESLARFKSGMHRRLPHGMAEVIVSPRQSAVDGSPRFRLQVACCCARAVDLGVEYGRPKLDLGENAAPGGIQPAEFLYAMSTWSAEKGQLRRWLNHHRRKHQDKLELVVWDDTGFRIPWELLWLPHVSEYHLPGGYLGALLTVTRWQTMEPDRPEWVRQFTNPSPYQANGPVVAYIADGMQDDRNLLRDFDVQDAADMEDLFARLANGPGPLAMVYVACHGEFGEDPGDCRLDGFALGRATLFDDDLPRLREQATLVFLNGCHTGEIGIDIGRYNDGALRGFATVFLRCGASGVLATAGAVGKEEARELAGALLNYLGANRDLSVADAVRQLRASAAEKIPALLVTRNSKQDQAAADKQLRPLLYPFMYVYFGSPRMVMSLAGRAASGEASEPTLTGGGGAP